MTDDITLLREYARCDSEEAFAALVSRHVNLVYSVALRDVHDPHLAEEITQAVFIILARKAESFDSKIVLSGWLCRTVRYTSANALSIQRRRQQREQEAYVQSLLNESESTVWTQISPLLGEAMKQLGQKDHDAVVLRFFENKSFQEIGAVFGASENAAKKRVAYALEKMRKYFSKHGVTSTTAIIAGAISANSVQAAPATLAKAVTTTAFAKGATASTSTLTLIKEALKIMAWTKAKTIIVVGVVAILAVGTTGFVITIAEKVSAAASKPLGRVSKQAGELTADRTTPKGTMLVMINAMEAGDANAYVESFVFKTDEELKLKPTLEALVAATASFNRALSDKFGAEAAHAELPNMPLMLPANIIDSGEQSINGDSATVSISASGKGGRPIQFTRINGEWRMAADGFIHLSPAVMNDIYTRVIKALNETTPEIPQNHFKTAMEAVDKMKERAR